MHYNPKTKFTRVVFKRTEQGVFVHKGEPYFIDAEKIDGFENGKLNLNDGEVILVEEDAEQIDKLLDLKLAELAAYEAYIRAIDRTGMEENGEPD